MNIVLYDGDDENSKKIYIVLLSDNNEQYYVFSKDYLHDTQAPWLLETGDIKSEVALLSEFDETFKGNDESSREARVWHAGSFCKQIQNELIDQINNPSQPLSENLQIYKECRSSILDNVAEIYAYDQVHWDYPDTLDTLFFVEDWKDVYGTDFVPPKEKGNDDGKTK